MDWLDKITFLLMIAVVIVALLRPLSARQDDREPGAGGKDAATPSASERDD
jgi:hypothetical protein